MRGPQVDDLHPDSDDAENVKIPNDDATDEKMIPVTDNDSAGDASKESAAPANGASNPSGEVNNLSGATEDVSASEALSVSEAAQDTSAAPSTATTSGAEPESPDDDVAD